METTKLFAMNPLPKKMLIFNRFLQTKQKNPERHIWGVKIKQMQNKTDDICLYILFYIIPYHKGDHESTISSSTLYSKWADQ